MGVVEGLTEFLPISSTGHLILMGGLLGFDDAKARVFDIAIQTGAIFAVVLVYWQKIKSTLVALPTERQARRFVLNVAIGFVPAVLLGLLFGKAIKEHLFTPVVVATTFIVGGFIILWAERRQANAVRVQAVDDMTPWDALKVGLVQCLAMVPWHQPQRRHHHRRHVAGAEPAGRDRLLFLLGHPHAGGRWGVQPVQRARLAVGGRSPDVFGGAGVFVPQRPGCVCGGCCATSAPTVLCPSPGTASPLCVVVLVTAYSGWVTWAA